MSIKISVIIPIYNVEKYLDKCLDSVLQQSLQDIEVICVYAKSNDQSIEILENYAQKDKRIVAFEQDGKGQGLARNQGLKIAQGEYVLFLDADDWLEEDALSKLYDKITLDNADIVFFNAKKYYEQTHKTDFFRFCDTYYQKFGEGVFSSLDISDVIYSTSPLPFKIYKLDFIKSNNIEFATTRRLEDHLFYFIALAKAQRMSVLNQYLYNYRIRDDSATYTIQKSINDCRDNLFECCKILEKDKDTSLFFNQFLSYKIRNFFFYRSIIEDKKNKKEFYKSMQESFRFIHEKYSDKAAQNTEYYWKYSLILSCPYEIYCFISKIFQTILVLKVYIHLF